MENFYKLLRKVNDKKLFGLLLVVGIVFILSPVIKVLIESISIDSEYMNALSESGLLFEGVVNTIELVIKVGLLSATIGFVLAYIMVFYNIKYSSVINILLIIPLGIPVYVAAYTYTNIFYEYPFLETIFRSNLFMDGAVFIYVLFLYPYVYIASKSYLSRHLTDYLEASSTLGLSPFKLFLRVVLPLSRPVIIGSVLFVIFETLSDYAVVEYYGELTLSRYIYIAWFNQGDIATASRFAVYILFIMFILIFVERLFRRNKRFTDSRKSLRQANKYDSNLFTRITQYLFIGAVILLGAVLPIFNMIKSAYIRRSYIDRLDIVEVVWNTLLVTSISIILIIVCAIVITTIVHYLKGSKKQFISSIIVLGYSIPSMVLALGVYMLYIRVDITLYPLFNQLIITSSILVIVIGFFLKFFSIGFSNLLSAYQKIDKELLESAEVLGDNKLTTMFRVNIPLLLKSISGIVIILFIDMLKELTIVYSLRPFNFKTLSTEVYRYAGNEMVEVAAFPSLIIIFLCTILIIILERGGKHVKSRKS